jgi:hypothetical protein
MRSRITGNEFIGENEETSFEKLLAEIDQGVIDIPVADFMPELQAIKLHAAAAGNTKAGTEFRKSLGAMAETCAGLTPKPPRTVIFMRKDALSRPSAGAEVIAKAFHTLQHGNLNADQRGRLMLALGNVADGVSARQATFSKALPTPKQLADPNVRRRTAAQVAADLEKVEHSLKGAAAHSHMKAATDLIDEARRMLASDDMSMGDHAILALKLGDLRSKMEGGQVHDKE